MTECVMDGETKKSARRKFSLAASTPPNESVFENHSNGDVKIKAGIADGKLG